MKAKRKLTPALRKRRDEQSATLMLKVHEIVCHAVKKMFDAGMSPYDVAFHLSGMETAAGRAVTADAATNAELDSRTGFWTHDSLALRFDEALVAEYGGHLADVVMKDTTSGEVTA